MSYWCPIPGASGYEVLSDGSAVRSIDREVTLSDGRVMPQKGKVLSLRLKQGYPTCDMRFDDWPRRSSFGLHRLVCLTFHGPAPSPEHEVRHLNGIKTDSRPENLAWGTKSENAIDSVVHGIHNMARKTHCPRGHEYDEVVPKGNGKMSRICRTCLRDGQKRRAPRYRARQTEKARAWRLANPEEARAQDAAYRETNRERIRKYAREYYHRHRDGKASA